MTGPGRHDTERVGRLYLEEWGRWLRSLAPVGPADRSATDMMFSMSSTYRRGSVVVTAESEERGLTVERLMSGLSHRQRRILKMYFYRGISIEGIRSEFRLSRRLAEAEIETAVGRVDYLVALELSKRV